MCLQNRQFNNTHPLAASTIFTTFVCDKFDGDQLFLRAELTLACDGSPARRGWVVFAAIMVVLFPIGVPALLFTLLYSNRDGMVRLVQELEQEPGSVAKLARRPSSSSRRPSFVARSERLAFIVSRVERLAAARWWVAPVQVLLRLAQTSVMVVVTRQSVQAALASSIAIAGFCLHREFMPFRRPSDNTTAVLAQATIFLWCFVLMLRDAGAFSSVPTVTIGVLLVVVTVAVVAHAAYTVRLELHDANENQQPSTTSSSTTAVAIEEDAGLADEEERHAPAADDKEAGDSRVEEEDQAGTTFGDQRGTLRI